MFRKQKYKTTSRQNQRSKTDNVCSLCGVPLLLPMSTLLRLHMQPHMKQRQQHEGEDEDEEK